MIASSESLPSTPPTERDLEIFAAVKVQCRRQVEVAEQFGISQSRVSQICRDVVQWRAGMGFSGELQDREGQRVEAWLDAQRLESLYALTMDHYRRSCQPQRRERKGTNQHGDWQSESIDHSPGNLQCLRLASRLMEQRWKMHEKCPQPSPQALAKCDEDTFLYRLVNMRHWAEVRGEVPRGEEPGRLVKRLLAELLGRGEKHPPAGQGSRTSQSSGSDETQTTQILASSATTADKLGAHATHIISAAPVPNEPPGDADNGNGSGCWETSCDATRQAKEGSEQREGERRNAADISAATAGQASSGTQTATTGRGYAEEERLALAELQRTFATELWPALADHSVPNILAEGQTNLMLQGYTREQRQALLGWQRVMDLRKQERERGARGVA